MRFKQYIDDSDILREFQINNYFNKFNEVFNFKTDINVIDKHKDHFSCNFEIDNVRYNYQSKIIEDTTAIIVFFPVKMLDMFDEVKSGRYSGKIFSMVLECTKYLINEYKDLNKIGFTLENNKLESLYDRMNKYILKKFNRWKFEGKFINSNGYIQYTYIKR